MGKKKARSAKDSRRKERIITIKLEGFKRGLSANLGEALTRIARDEGIIDYHLGKIAVIQDLIKSLSTKLDKDIIPRVHVELVERK